MSSFIHRCLIHSTTRIYCSNCLSPHPFRIVLRSGFWGQSFFYRRSRRKDSQEVISSFFEKEFTKTGKAQKHRQDRFCILYFILYSTIRLRRWRWKKKKHVICKKETYWIKCLVLAPLLFSSFLYLFHLNFFTVCEI